MLVITMIEVSQSYSMNMKNMMVSLLHSIKQKVVQHVVKSSEESSVFITFLIFYSRKTKS